MSKREVKRNGRGQIISYEIFTPNDSATTSPQYGDVLLTTPATEGQSGERLHSSAVKQTMAFSVNRVRFNNGVQPTSPNYDPFTDISFSEEFINQDDILEPKDVFARFEFKSIAGFQ